MYVQALLQLAVLLLVLFLQTLLSGLPAQRLRVLLT